MMRGVLLRCAARMRCCAVCCCDALLGCAAAVCCCSVLLPVGAVLLRCVLLLRCALLRPLDAAARGVRRARHLLQWVCNAERALLRVRFTYFDVAPLAQPFFLPRVLAANLAVACLSGTSRYNYCLAK